VTRGADSPMAAALGELGQRLAELSPAMLDASVRDCARRRLFDALGAAALGLATPEGRVLARRAAAFDAEVSSGVARANLWVGAARATEVDDIDIASCTTVGAVVVPAALAVAAARSSDGLAVLAAIVAGYEAMTRLGRALAGATLLYRGVWPTYVTAAFAAAAAAAKLLDLDGATTARALALALARVAPLPAGAATRFAFRYYALGAAAGEGIDAAVAAAAGVEAEPSALAPFAERLGAALDERELAAPYGAPWRVAAVDTKLWPTSRQALASVAAFMELAAEADPADIERVEVEVPGPYRAMIDRPARPSQRIESMLGVQYQLGLVAFAPAALYDVARERLAIDERIDALMAKVELRASAALEAAFPERWGSRVSVRWRSGKEAAREVLEPEGSSARPLDWPALERKLARLLPAGAGVHEAAAELGMLCRRVGAPYDVGAGAAELFAAAQRLAAAGPGAR
jgi:2-methylcitrate dehydratase PrpD